MKPDLQKLHKYNYTTNTAVILSLCILFRPLHSPFFCSANHFTNNSPFSKKLAYLICLNLQRFQSHYGILRVEGVSILKKSDQSLIINFFFVIFNLFFNQYPKLVPYCYKYKKFKMRVYEFLNTKIASIFALFFIIQNINQRKSFTLMKTEVHKNYIFDPFYQ